jgi:hypothetical protein
MNLKISTTASPVKATYMVLLWNMATPMSVRPNKINSIRIGPMEGIAEELSATVMAISVRSIEVYFGVISFQTVIKI